MSYGRTVVGDAVWKDEAEPDMLILVDQLAEGLLSYYIALTYVGNVRIVELFSAICPMLSMKSIL